MLKCIGPALSNMNDHLLLDILLQNPTNILQSFLGRDLIAGRYQPVKCSS